MSALLSPDASRARYDARLRKYIVQEQSADQLRVARDRAYADALRVLTPPAKGRSARAAVPNSPSARFRTGAALPAFAPYDRGASPSKRFGSRWEHTGSLSGFGDWPAPHFADGDLQLGDLDFAGNSSFELSSVAAASAPARPGEAEGSAPPIPATAGSAPPGNPDEEEEEEPADAEGAVPATIEAFLTKKCGESPGWRNAVSRVAAQIRDS
jgi:hypothetical protein